MCGKISQTCSVTMNARYWKGLEKTMFLFTYNLFTAEIQNYLLNIWSLPTSNQSLIEGAQKAANAKTGASEELSWKLRIIHHESIIDFATIHHEFSMKNFVLIIPYTWALLRCYTVNVTYLHVTQKTIVRAWCVKEYTYFYVSTFPQLLTWDTENEINWEAPQRLPISDLTLDWALARRATSVRRVFGNRDDLASAKSAARATQTHDKCTKGPRRGIVKWP